MKLRSMKFGLKFALIVIALIACFLGGWEFHKNQSLAEPRPVQYVQDGHVIKVHNNVVAINKGISSDVKTGDSVNFFRNNRWIGTGVVSLTHRNASKVVMPLKTIQEGDRMQILKYVNSTNTRLTK